MSQISAMQSAVGGIQSGMYNFAKDAQAIAKASTDSDSGQDITKPVVNLVADRNQVEASAKSAKIADGAIGTLLDVVA